MTEDKREETSLWAMYDKCKNFMSMRGIFADTDRNYRMYNGDQWSGLKIEGVEKIQFNIIKPIIKYKVANITTNLYSVVYSAENIENSDFREVAVKTCELLNKKANSVFDKDFLDKKIKKIAKQSAINDEAVMYVDYNKELNLPVNEIISKNDIMYGNENEDEIQLQPYILIRRRMTVLEVKNIAKQYGFKKKDIDLIIGDKETDTASGDSAKEELDDRVTFVTKMYRKNGTIYFTQGTRYLTLKEDVDSGLKYYPVAHLNWEDQEGNARGIGETRQLIHNQLEINKTAMRRAITVKNTAYPQKIVNTSKITNKDAINRVGSTIEFEDPNGLTKASDVFMNTSPAQMSSDSEKLQLELINNTRDLAGAGDIATGDINPESASGKAILAVQQATQQPLTEQLVSLKSFLEELARIWLDMWRVYSENGLIVELEKTDFVTGQVITRSETINPIVLERLQANVKVDITPRGAFDKYAQELSLENMFMNGKITFEEYVESLDSDSVMPKTKLETIIEKRKEAQKQINLINQQADMLKVQTEQQNARALDIESIANMGNQIRNEMQATM